MDSALLATACWLPWRNWQGAWPFTGDLLQPDEGHYKNHLFLQNRYVQYTWDLQLSGSHVAKSVWDCEADLHVTDCIMFEISVDIFISIQYYRYLLCKEC